MHPRTHYYNGECQITPWLQPACQANRETATAITFIDIDGSERKGRYVGSYECLVNVHSARFDYLQVVLADSVLLLSVHRLREQGLRAGGPRVTHEVRSGEGTL